MSSGAGLAGLLESIIYLLGSGKMTSEYELAHEVKKKYDIWAHSNFFQCDMVDLLIYSLLLCCDQLE